MKNILIRGFGLCGKSVFIIAAIISMLAVTACSSSSNDASSGDNNSEPAPVFQSPSLAYTVDTTYHNWMSVNQDKIGSKNLNEVTLLGAHDSSSYAITTSSGICQGYQQAMQPTLSTPPNLKKYKTQKYDILTQLKFGVRYLMFDVALHSEAYWSYHGYYSLQFWTGDDANPGIFDQIKAFLKDNPDEIIIIHLLHFVNSDNNIPPTTNPADINPWFLSNDQINDFYNWIISSDGPDLGSYLISPPSDYSSSSLSLTFNQIWNNSKTQRIVLLFSYDDSSNENDNPNPPPLPPGGTVPSQPSGQTIVPGTGWGSGLIDDPWKNVNNIKEFTGLQTSLGLQVNSYAEGKKSGKLKELQAMLSTNDKIGDAVCVNVWLAGQFAETGAWYYWKTAPVSIVMVDNVIWDTSDAYQYDLITPLISRIGH